MILFNMISFSRRRLIAVLPAVALFYALACSGSGERDDDDGSRPLTDDDSDVVSSSSNAGAGGSGAATSSTSGTGGMGGMEDVLPNDGSELLFSSVTELEALAVDDTSVYVQARVDNTISLMKGPKTGGFLTTLTSGQATGCRQIHVYEGWLYYCNDDGLYRIPTAGGAPTLLDAISCESAFLVDESGVYCANLGSVLWHVPHAGGDGSVVLDVVFIGGVTSDANDVFVTSTPNFDLTVYRVAKSDGAVSVVATPEGSFNSSGMMLTSAGDSLFFIEGFDGLLQLPKAGGTEPVAIAGTVGSGRGLIAAGTELFWGFSYQGIKRIAATGGPSAWVAYSQPSFDHALAVDDSHVYWVRQGGGEERQVLRTLRDTTLPAPQ